MVGAPSTPPLSPFYLFVILVAALIHSWEKMNWQSLQVERYIYLKNYPRDPVRRGSYFCELRPKDYSCYFLSSQLYQ